ncbi:hypothetical protein EYZ11_005176 [Aspergillus tanneri]|nr:hypothetical protein EYZ11_005176 [Aspergillus tanneri]
MNDDPNISLAFLHLPDGNLDGSGFPATGTTSLVKLWNGQIQKLDTVDGLTKYTNESLVETLTDLMRKFEPEQVKTQDYIQGGGDHSDHHTGAKFAREAARVYDAGVKLTGYLGYPVVELPENVQGSELEVKQAAFYKYGMHDAHTCDSQETCKDRVEAQWLARQYTV